MTTPHPPQTDAGARHAVTISVNYWPKPIPIRHFDWSAIDSSTFDGEGCPIGYGATEQEAIDDLKMQLDEAEGRS
jgi:hypothetical protein